MREGSPGAWKHVLAGACASFLFSGCSAMSDHVSDESAGLNGGFEVASDGLPVNWLLYTPRKVSDADSRIVLDTVVFKEGRQSLKFLVTRVGSRRRPGFTNEFSDSGRFYGPATYRISFWARSDGAEFMVRGGPVRAMDGDVRVLIRDDARLEEWTPFEFTTDIPDGRWLRLELAVLSAGTFWIDDVRIERID